MNVTSDTSVMPRSLKRSIVAAGMAALALTGCSIIRVQPTPTTPSGNLSGVVTGPGGPVAGASVQVTPSNASTVVTVSNTNGYYEFLNLAEGPANISVTAGGFYPYTGSVSIVAKTTTTLNVSLSPR